MESSNQEIVVIGDSPSTVPRDSNHIINRGYPDLLQEDLLPGISRLIPSVTPSAPFTITPGPEHTTNQDLHDSSLQLTVPGLSHSDPYVTLRTLPENVPGIQFNITEDPPQHMFPFLKLPPEIR